MQYTVSQGTCRADLALFAEAAITLETPVVHLLSLAPDEVAFCMAEGV
jgi:hypothetical protein